jgi:hypothetical protein
MVHLCNFQWWVHLALPTPSRCSSRYVASDCVGSPRALVRPFLPFLSFRHLTRLVLVPMWCNASFELFCVPSPQSEEVRVLAQGSAADDVPHLHYRQPLPAAVPLLVTQSTRWCDVGLFLHHTTLAVFSNSDSDSSADRGQLRLPALRRPIPRVFASALLLR